MTGKGERRSTNQETVAGVGVQGDAEFAHRLCPQTTRYGRANWYRTLASRTAMRNAQIAAAHLLGHRRGNGICISCASLPLVAP